MVEPFRLCNIAARAWLTGADGLRLDANDKAHDDVGEEEEIEQRVIMESKSIDCPGRDDG